MQVGDDDSAATSGPDDGPLVGGSVKSAARALDLLDDIAANGPATRAELSLRMGIPKSSIHAVLRTMTARGWLELDHAGGAYRLGFRALVLSPAFLESDPAVRRAAPMLDRLAAVTGETVHLARLHGDHMIVLDKRDPVRPAPMASAVGRRLPAYGTAMGRAVLATRPGETREEIVPEVIEPLTPHTTTDRGRVLDLIAQAEALGYAVESEEACRGVRCFGVALPPVGAAAYALSVAVPLDRLDGPLEIRTVRTLLGLAAGTARVHVANAGH